ncbi:lish protein [Naviculisporaceae sp. PSN 640]
MADNRASTMKELLDTDRVNFLIWRYLLESNYRETAAKFQKEWRIQAPHKQFDFAPHVNVYALVSLLNKGLIYESYERQHAKLRQVPEDAAATAEATGHGVFGPLKFEPAPKDIDMDDDDEDDSDVEPEEYHEAASRKRPMERPHHGLSNGSPVNKRQRLSNGFENGADSATDPMEIDHGTDNHAYPSPLEGEQAISPAPHTEGPEQGTQVDKVNELTQETVFLQLGGVDSESSANPLVLQCEWNPKDPSILAVAGTDALARVWTISRGSAPAAQLQDSQVPVDHVDGIGHPFQNLLEDEVPRDATVQALAWNGAGSALALAVEAENKARICVYGLDGAPTHRFDGFEPPVIKLCWSPDDDLILGLSPEKSGTLITVFSLSMANSASYYYADHELTAATPLEITWTGETEFVLCGNDCLLGFRWTKAGILPGREFRTGKNEAFRRVQFDFYTKMIATTSDKGTIDLWDESGGRRSIVAHMGLIHALQWQPLQNEPPVDERLLASGGEDGVISVWNVRKSENKPLYSTTLPTPILGLSMTPDGAFIAAATMDNIFIWKVGEHHVPRAHWSRTPHPGWQSPKANSEEEEFIPTMGWNSEGQKLVFGANSRLAVIRFR